jgi:hypothetical protein
MSLLWMNVTISLKRTNLIQTDNSILHSFFPSSSIERHFNEIMTRHHHQFPVMQLPEGAQSENHPKNVTSVAHSPSLTSTLINNNCLMTLREMMQQQQHHQQLQQYQMELMQQQRREDEKKKASHNRSISTTPLSPNSSSQKLLLQKYHHHQPTPPTAEKHERNSPPFLIGKPETASIIRQENKNNNQTGANCFKHVKSEYQTTGRTVREELEASRCRNSKTGEISSQFF